MGLYTGFDLHSTNTYVGIIDENGGRLWKKKLRNDPSLISEALKPFKKDIEGIVVAETRALRFFERSPLPLVIFTEFRAAETVEWSMLSIKGRVGRVVKVVGK